MCIRDSLGTSAGADSSSISASGLAEFSSGILELLADIACNASFPEDEFERERRQRLEELKIERTTPGFLASERLRRILFGAHPYAVVAPTEEQLAGFTRDPVSYTHLDVYKRQTSRSSSIASTRSSTFPPRPGLTS